MKPIKNQPHHVGTSQKDIRKVYFKHDGCSMLIFDKLTYYNASVRVNALMRLYPDWKGKFIITR